MESHFADTILFAINHFPGKPGSDLPRNQLLKLYCHLYLLVSPPSFETILSNMEMDL